MRTDASFDARQVRCPNATTLGYGKRNAQVGDLIIFKEGERTQLGRMLARITYAPALTGDKTSIRNWLCVAVLHQGIHIGERWVNPTDVLEVKRITKRTLDTVACFFGADLRKTSKRNITEARMCVSEGWSSLKAFRAWVEDRGVPVPQYQR